MLQTRRASRIGSLRRTLTVEALEDRTLLTGVVTAVMNVGELLITGDNADNQFTIAPSPNDPREIRISGNPLTFTAVNGVAFADFLTRTLTDISISLQNGKTNVTVRDFNISGDLTIFYGNPDAVISTPNFHAANIDLIFSPAPGFTPTPVPGVNPSPFFPGIVGSGNNGGLLVPTFPGFGFGSGSTGSQTPPVSGGNTGGSTGSSEEQTPPVSGGSTGSSEEQTPPVSGGNTGGSTGSGSGQTPPVFGGIIGSGNNGGLLLLAGFGSSSTIGGLLRL